MSLKRQSDEVFKEESAERFFADCKQISQYVRSGNMDAAEMLLTAIQSTALSYIAREGKEDAKRALLGRVVVGFNRKISTTEGAIAVGVATPKGVEVDEETYDAIAEAASDMHEIPLMQGDGSWTTGSFFALGEKLNTAANDDVRGKAIAKYNELVPEEDLIVDAMSQDENVRYPELLYSCLGDEIVRLVKKHEPIDSKLGAAVRFFGINVNASEFVAEQIWAEIEENLFHEQKARILAREKALFNGTSVALELLKNGELALIAFDGT